MGLKRLLLEALETRDAPPPAMRRAMVWSSGLDDDLEQLPIVRSLNRGTLSVKALREVEGRVEVHVGDDVVTCGAGDSYLVPEGAVRHYKVVEDLVAVEATSPPARVDDRDDG